MEQYTNRQLAADYVSIAALNLNYEPHALRSAGKKIAESPVDIPSFHQEHGSLKGLRVAGVGPKTRPILEAILREGADIVRKRVGDDQERALRWQTPRTPGAVDRRSDYDDRRDDEDVSDDQIAGLRF